MVSETFILYSFYFIFENREKNASEKALSSSKMLRENFRICCVWWARECMLKMYRRVSTENIFLCWKNFYFLFVRFFFSSFADRTANPQNNKENNLFMLYNEILLFIGKFYKFLCYFHRALFTVGIFFNELKYLRDFMNVGWKIAEPLKDVREKNGLYASFGHL